MLHGDLNPGNILIDDGGTAWILDMEDAIHSWGAPLRDLAFAAERLALVPDGDRSEKLERITALCQGYNRASACPVRWRPGRLEAALRALSWRALMLLCHRERRGLDSTTAEWTKFFALWRTWDTERELLGEVDSALSRLA